MSSSDLLLAQMQKFLYRAIESGKNALLNATTLHHGVRGATTQLCRVDVPMWMAGGWVVTVGPPPNMGRAPEEGIPPGMWPVDVTDSYAVITFGHGSAVHRVEVDIGRGFRIGLWGSSVDVRIVQPPDPISAWVFGYPYRLPGSIVRGELGAANHCRKSVFVADVGTASTSDPHAIPAFARQVSLMATMVAGSTPYLYFYDRAGTVLRQTAMFRNTDMEWRLQAPTIIPPDATMIAVRNNGGVSAMTSVRLIFDLHL